MCVGGGGGGFQGENCTYINVKVNTACTIRTSYFSGPLFTSILLLIDWPNCLIILGYEPISYLCYNLRNDENSKISIMTDTNAPLHFSPYSLVVSSGLFFFSQVTEIRNTQTSWVSPTPYLPRCPSRPHHRLAGLVVKASASGAEDPGFESRLRRNFSGSCHTSDFKTGTPVATMPGAWRDRVSAGTGWPGVSIL